MCGLWQVWQFFIGFFQRRSDDKDMEAQYNKNRTRNHPSETEGSSVDKLNIDYETPKRKRFSDGAAHQRYHPYGKNIDGRLSLDSYRTASPTSPFTPNITCFLCKQKGHKQLTRGCLALLSEPHTDVTPFQGEFDILSNFYHCHVQVFGQVFPSSEHAYQWRKAMLCNFPDVAVNILNAPTSKKAKFLSKRVQVNDDFNSQKVKILKEIAEAKFRCVAEYRDQLNNAKSVIVEAVRGDNFWSVGLAKDQVLDVEMNYWPGQNQMGRIHMAIRDEQFGSPFTDIYKDYMNLVSTKTFVNVNIRTPFTPEQSGRQSFREKQHIRDELQSNSRYSEYSREEKRRDRDCSPSEKKHGDERRKRSKEKKDDYERHRKSKKSKDKKKKHRSSRTSSPEEDLSKAEKSGVENDKTEGSAVDWHELPFTGSMLTSSGSKNSSPIKIKRPTDASLTQDSPSPVDKEKIRSWKKPKEEEPDIQSYALPMQSASEGNPCSLCHRQGHCPLEETCLAFKEHPHTEVTPFQGAGDILSNFYMCKITVFGREFASSEHAYQWKKAITCGKEDLAEKILAMSTSREVKMLSKQIETTDEFKATKVDLLSSIAKEKFKSVPEFQDALKNARPVIVEAVQDDMFWSVGLTKVNVLRTKMKYWPGENQMGRILMRLRDKMFESPPSEFYSEYNSWVSTSPWKKRQTESPLSLETSLESKQQKSSLHRSSVSEVKDKKLKQIESVMNSSKWTVTSNCLDVRDIPLPPEPNPDSMQVKKDCPSKRKRTSSSESGEKKRKIRQVENSVSWL